MVFYKRLSDVFEDEFADYVAQYGDEQVTLEVIEADHTDALQSGRRPIVRFYIPPQYSWLKIRNHGADGKLGEFVTTAIAIVGLDDSSGQFTQLYADGRGVFRVYQMRFQNGVWELWRDAPGFFQRFKGVFSEDGKTITAFWDFSEDGETWGRDFDLTYKKIK